jgi:tRNA pseudouridine55 synthase
MDLHGFLAIDKPTGWTSHDVVARSRRLLQTRRVGHAGTLDPAASGVLILGIGKATRLIDAIQHQSKQYVAHVVLGVASSTADIDGTLEVSSESRPARNQVERVVATFFGEIEQIPPKYSAIKQGGVPLYRLARRGEEVDVPSRKVRIDRLDVLAFSYPDLLLRIDCGPGFYVRSLARDIGEALGAQAYLHHLLRTRVGGFGLDDCWTIDQINAGLRAESWTAFGIHPEIALVTKLAAVLDGDSANAWYHGRSVGPAWRAMAAGTKVRAYQDNGSWSGFGVSAADRVRPRLVYDYPSLERD